MEADQPVGGQWNFDADNREAFGAAGPGPCRRARASRPTRSRAR
jgi:deoxyribodipyrimidine photolyase-related protein